MAGTGLLAMFDDIATVLDDVSLMTKIAAKKTAGVLGDDLALNAEQVSGVRADRELPVVWAVAKGSFINKMILVPAALLISFLLPWLITPMLMLGGAFLCYEGVEKLFHKYLHSNDQHQAELSAAFADQNVDLVEFEKDKIKGAIRTDFILSAEIIIITLGIVEESAFMTQLAVLYAIAIGVTIFVYGLVAGIVKLDDAGLYLIKLVGSDWVTELKRKIGRGLLSFAPYLMKSLAVIGTIAMFLVGGGIMIHGLPILHHQVEAVNLWAEQLPSIGMVLTYIAPTMTTFVVGIIVGLIALLVVSGVKKLLPVASSA